ncbi:dephospho-CoA kinase [Aromatoleum toluclasticum]|uniref:dephospho-CoA kinase n=1 Tax=Aromatoleum toluclasticum TaxID=92003 RepID=UPI00035F54B2|nr:dephospho-CoA kinase [Aromatoleum toluclasticum]MCC4115006.1 dephospho-CoA kinase [Aromatoleum toluclasticum]
MSNSPYVVGLTGGIGSGKSAAADRFAELGAAIVDTDAIAHALTGPGGQAIPAIRAAFGDTVITPDGALDRKVMRDRAFADPNERRRLEAILHPAIGAESARQVSEARAPYVVLVVPLLVESGKYRERCHSLCVVDCPVEVQIARVMTRSRLPEEQVRAIMATQASREQRLAAADDVIDNGGDLATLLAQVERLHEKYLAAARAVA